MAIGISIVVLALSLVCFSGADEIISPIPVNSPEPGTRYNAVEPIPKVRLETFMELNCPDSMRAWPILKDVQAHYGAANLDVIFHQIPLPYHRNGFLTTQGLWVIREHLPGQQFNYMEAAMGNWSQLSTASTRALTQYEVLDMLGDIAQQSTGIDKATYIAEIDIHITYTTQVWKYAATRGVSATPTFFLNGVNLVVGASVPTFEDWIIFLDPFFLPAADEQ